MTSPAIEMLLIARRIANYAKDEGVLTDEKKARLSSDHLGAVLADSVLQAGLNYKSVVRPRVLEILRKHPECLTISSLISVIQNGGSGAFLNWRHHEKISRFEALVIFLHGLGIENAEDLRAGLGTDEFCSAIQTVNGIGPKTVDYMACLVGLDTIAVDRHVRAFAKAVKVDNDDYQFLRETFCYAADLLSLPRREFDAWLWRRAVAPVQDQAQLALAV
ncbi:hypothetical protein [Halomonas sp. BC1]|uniref:hypothetical protein n=1 Tax=Halomonas sp. BC1 TaxID=1670448 RepID=UPI0009BF6E37|nr:hypothetical protein [Halomonas sp. BC1]